MTKSLVIKKFVNKNDIIKWIEDYLCKNSIKMPKNYLS